MLTQYRNWVALPAVAALSFTVGACQRVPLLAPTGSTITLTASASALSANGTTSIIAQVLEAAGTPPHSGTHITFTTTIGRIEPAEVETDIGGRVTVRFIAGGQNGTATINAVSGGATTGAAGALKIAVGTAAVGRVSVSASPASVPAAGGTTTITAFVIDVNGNPLVATPVSFSATTGSLASSLVLTDTNGNAATTLTTTTESTVTANVGASTTTTGPGTPTPSGQASGTVTVKVTAAPTIAITAPTTAPVKGIPAFFTVTVTAATGGSAIKEVTLNWGDGTVQSLGSVTGAQSVSHIFRSDGGFLITATVTDVAGNTNSAAAPISVSPGSAPNIIITAPSSSLSVDLPAFFSFTVTAASPAVPVQSVVVNWGDGNTQALGSFTGSQSASHAYRAAGSYLVAATVTDVNGNSNTSSAPVNVLLLASPSIVVSATPKSAAVGATFTFTISISPPAGLGISSTSIDFGDGSSQSLGGATSATVTHSYGLPTGTKTVTVTVVDTTGRVSTSSTTVVVT